MAQPRDTFEKDECREKVLGTTLVAETLRSAASNNALGHPSKSEENVSWFWKIFGGTILSIVALVIVTAYTGVSTSLTDLRRDLNQMLEVRAEYLKKDELNTRLTTLWNAIKELQTSHNALAALSERAKLLDVQMDKQLRTGDDDRRDLARRLDEHRRCFADEQKEFQRRMENLAERLASMEGRAGSTSNLPKATPASTTTPLRKLTKPLTGG